MPGSVRWFALGIFLLFDIYWSIPAMASDDFMRLYLSIAGVVGGWVLVFRWVDFQVNHGGSNA